MRSSNSQPPDQPGQESAKGRCKSQLADRRKRPFLVPNYVIDVFGARLRPPGIALYVALCRHADSQQTCFPALATLARETGMHRGTVIRVLRRLLALGLLSKVKRRDAKFGDRSNLYLLVDPDLMPLPPPSISEGGSSAALLGGSRSATPPVALRDPPSSAARPTLNEGSPSEGSPVREAPSPDFVSPLDQREVGALVALWLDLLTTRGKGVRAEHAAEIAAEVAELLRLGWKVEQLRESMEAPDRARWEWPREWRARVAAARGKVTQKPLDPGEVAQKRAQASEQAKKDREDLNRSLGGKTLSETMKNRKRLE